MAFNPSPKVAEARAIADKFGMSHVIILMLSTDDETIQYASYGRTTKECKEAEGLADVAYNAVYKRICAEGL